MLCLDNRNRLCPSSAWEIIVDTSSKFWIKRSELPKTCYVLPDKIYQTYFRWSSPNKINEEKIYLQCWMEFKYQIPNLVKIKEILDKYHFHSWRSKGTEILSACRVEQQQIYWFLGLQFFICPPKMWGWYNTQLNCSVDLILSDLQNINWPVRTALMNETHALNKLQTAIW